MSNIFTHSFSRGSSFLVSVSRCAPSAKFSSPARCARLSAAPVRPGAGRRRPARPRLSAAPVRPGAGRRRPARPRPRPHPPPLRRQQQKRTTGRSWRRCCSSASRHPQDSPSHIRLPGIIVRQICSSPSCFIGLI
jgi:hypothetical protein